MKVEAQGTPFEELHADLHVTTLYEGADLPPHLASSPGARDAKPGFK